MNIAKEYKSKIIKKYQKIIADENYVECIKVAYDLVGKTFTTNRILNDIQRCIITKNTLSSRVTIWYLDENKNIGIDYKTKKVIWNKRRSLI